MKSIFISALFFFCVASLEAQAGYAKADSIAKAFDEQYTDAADLAQKLTRSFSDDRDKARAIFAWVAFNIRYDYKKFKDPPPCTPVTWSSRQELEEKLREMREKEIRKTLRNKKGVCGDYSLLFQKMCASVGLESVIVTGVSRRPNGKVAGNHAWNAVKIGGEWQLLDATWGAGYVDDDDERFIRRYTPAYFSTPPALFILNHLPHDDKWQLLDKPLSKKAFGKQPLINFSHPDCPIESFSPENGKIALSDGKAEVRFKFNAQPDVFVVAAGENREIPAQVKTTDDNWTVLTFSPGRASEVSVFVGKSRRKTMMLAEFSVE